VKISEGTKYIINIKKFSFGGISKGNLKEIFKDGRVFGLLSEYLLPTISNGEIKKEPGNKYFDLSKKKEKIEQRTLTDEGLRLIPSSQIGTGRSYNSEVFTNKIKEVKWFFIIDNTKFPYLEGVFIQSDKLDLVQTRYKYNSARKKFFDNCKREVIFDL